jgi:hypothetical protein
MNPIDQSAADILSALEKAFPDIPVYRYPTSKISTLPLGLEIEVPWSAYHPALWKEYFKEGSVTYKELSAERKMKLDHVCGEEERMVLQNINKAEQCMKLFHGKKYWEFCFPPAHDIGTLLNMVRLLKDAGLCPFNGPHRMQVTIGGISPTKYAYQALMYLELRYGSKERMLQGTEKIGWAFKGQAGLFHKQKDDLLFGYESAVEFRPLVLPESLEELALLLEDCAFLGSELHKIEHDGKISDHMKVFSSKMSCILGLHGLPDTRWPNPREDAYPWRRFIERYDSLKAATVPLYDLGFV